MNSICQEIVDKFIPFQFNSVTEQQNDQVIHYVPFYMVNIKFNFTGL